ncbi:MAG: nucleotide exchange factor GrpE [Alphaproteobacteria bacterium CG11_big_fil_rev_8_21_14_0_20_44_7]|nr:MAG: nucleotide exchange factor GrpE [Alphaproteobacteria bacterium CG11_big_fil_rev_8_21_14_0_20_44_7]
MAKNPAQKANEEDNIEAQLDENIIEQARAATGVNDEVEALKTQLEELREAMLRAAADAENTRKRAAKEVEEANKYGVASFAKDLISVLENLQRATDSVPEKENLDGVLKNLFEGVDLTRKELLGVFEKRGIQRVEPNIGDKFDHNLHQAMAQVEDPKVEPGCIIQSMQSGYILHERLLRPAMVVVSKGNSGKPSVDTSA